MFFLSFAALLLALSAAYYDIRSYRIPRSVTASGTVFFVLSRIAPAVRGDRILNILQPFFVASAISLSVTAVIIISEKVLNKKLMGGGDIRLIFMMCLYFDWLLDLEALFIACVIAAITAVFTGHKRPVPFAAALAAGWISACLFRLYL